MNTRKIADYLPEFPFWKHLTAQEKGLLLQNVYIRSFDGNSYILHPRADEDIGMMMILEGRIHALALSQDGREVTLFSLDSGNICVFSAVSLFKQITFRVFLQADGPCSALVINMSLLERLMTGNIYFRCFAYELMAERFSSTVSSMQRLLFCGLEQRLASFLFNEYLRQKQTMLYLTHDYIAKHIGTSRERVTKTLKGLCEDGLIRRGKGVIEIVDAQGLKRAALLQDTPRERERERVRHNAKTRYMIRKIRHKGAFTEPWVWMTISHRRDRRQRRRKATVIRRSRWL